MIFFISLQKKCTVFLMVLLAATYALPAEAHVDVCIGNDGHVKIEVIDCQVQEQAGRQLTHLPSHEIHTDCLDIQTSCDGNSRCGSYLFSSRQRMQRYRLAIVSQAPPLIQKFFPAQNEQGRTIKHHHSTPARLTSLLSLRSVILLI